jgi:fluoroquinolone transport system permease protein
MKKILTLISTDLRQIFRDKTLTIFLLFPLLLIGFVRVFVPYITEAYPIMEDYHPMMMMYAGIQTAILFGFIVSFIILDERDENVLQVIRVLPISPFYFIVYRLLFATFFSAFGAFLMLNLSGISYPGFWNSIMLSIHYGLTAPFITLIIASYAKNKVEGMAYFKGIGLILLLPILSFFIEGNVRFIFGIIPAFWTFRLFEASLNDDQPLLYFTLGLLMYGSVIFFLYLQFKKKVFDK